MWLGEEELSPLWYSTMDEKGDKEMKCPICDHATNFKTVNQFTVHLLREHDVKESIALQIWCNILQVCPHCLAVIPSSCTGCLECGKMVKSFWLYTMIWRSIRLTHRNHLTQYVCGALITMTTKQDGVSPIRKQLTNHLNPFDVSTTPGNPSPRITLKACTSYSMQGTD